MPMYIIPETRVERSPHDRERKTFPHLPDLLHQDPASPAPDRVPLPSHPPNPRQPHQPPQPHAQQQHPATRSILSPEARVAP